MKIENIFFDFNGTLLDDLSLTYNIEEEMLKEHGLKGHSLDFYRDNFGFPVINYYILVGYDFNVTRYEDLAIEFMTKYKEREKTQSKLFENVKDVLSKLKNEGYKLHILSASETSLLRSQLEHLGILEYFEGFSADDNIAAKGKIEYGNRYLDHNNINRENTVIIGDTVHDYEVAKALGLYPIMFTAGHNSKKILEPLGTKMVDNYTELYSLIKELDN